MSRITTKDKTQIYYKDCGIGLPIVFCHGWPLNADAWKSQMVFLVSHGYRCIAHYRRGHGRSDQPSNGNNMDTYAADLAELFDALDLKGATLVVSYLYFFHTGYKDFQIRSIFRLLRETNVHTGEAIEVIKEYYPYLQFDTIRIKDVVPFSSFRPIEL